MRGMSRVEDGYGYELANDNRGTKKKIVDIIRENAVDNAYTVEICQLSLCLSWCLK